MSPRARKRLTVAACVLAWLGLATALALAAGVPARQDEQTNAVLAERINGLHREFAAYQAAEADRIRTALSAMDTRLEGMNEFRAQLNQQTQTFELKSVSDERYERLNDRVVRLERVAYLASAGVAVVLFLLNLWNRRGRPMTMLARRLDETPEALPPAGDGSTGG